MTQPHQNVHTHTYILSADTQPLCVFSNCFSFYMIRFLRMDGASVVCRLSSIYRMGIENVTIRNGEKKKTTKPKNTHKTQQNITFHLNTVFHLV